MSKYVFSEEITKLQTSDKAHADTFNPLFEALLNNTLFLKELVSNINQAIEETVNNQLNGVQDHIASKENPHEVTKTQLGLENVENYGIATNEDAQVGTSTTTYMTPALTKILLEKLGVTSSMFNGHTGNTSNPHAVTKTQVGLGNVQNYGVATTAQVEDATATNVYVTPAGLASLKSSVANGKTSVANAINGKLGTTLSNQNTFDEYANNIAKLYGLKLNTNNLSVSNTSNNYSGNTFLIYNSSNDTNVIIRIQESCQYEQIVITDTGTGSKKNGSIESFGTITLNSNEITIIKFSKVITFSYVLSSKGAVYKIE